MSVARCTNCQNAYKKIYSNYVTGHCQDMPFTSISIQSRKSIHTPGSHTKDIVKKLQLKCPSG